MLSPRRPFALGLLLLGAQLGLTGCEVKFDNTDPTRSSLGVCSGSTMTAQMSDDASAKLNRVHGVVAYRDLAQSFISLGQTEVSEIQLMLRGRAPGASDLIDGRLRVELQTDSGNDSPSGGRVAIGAYAELEGSSISVNRVRTYTFTLVGPTRIEANRKYWVRLTGTYSTDSPTFVEWIGTKTNPETQGQAMALTVDAQNWAELTVPGVPAPAPTLDLAFRLGCP